MRMEVVDQGRRVCRERAKMCVETRVMKPTFKKVQVLYYLSRTGHLQHPHYIEVNHLAHQHLRLKDVLDRLTVLRGNGMPSLYSWSSKRSYKNGYVWNDLGQNDVIYPSEGGEYVLKGSELVLGCTEKLQHHLQIGHVQQFQHENHHQTGQDSNFQPKRIFLAPRRQNDHQETMNNQYDHNPEEENVEEEEEEHGEKTRNTRCSRGVSTEETGEEFKQKDSKKNNHHTELNLDMGSLSSPPSTTHSENPNNETVIINNLSDHDNSSKRFEDGDPVANEPMLSRNSMLFSLIACGGSGSFRKTVLLPNVKETPPLPPLQPCTAARKSGSGFSLNKGVVCKAAAAKMAVEEDDLVMINYMSENPRFGNLQAEEKDYFSGSIVESITNEEKVGPRPRLKKSSSYNQERSIKAGLGEAAEEEVKRVKRVKGKCIPRNMKKSASKQPNKK